jgi:ubiquinone/menaquinone biosynthesis C-methylase UbiE
MSSKFNARDADAYERLMGRWSRVLARPFLEFSGLASGERILDVGCGTGSLTFTIPQVVDVAHVQGIDFSSVYVEAARQRITNPRITISQGDVCGLSFQDATFDRSLALLVVLHFVPESQRAVSEMSRVVKPGGVVAAAVWDSYGGVPWLRTFWDTAVALFPSAASARAENLFKPMSRPGEMLAVFEQAGLCDVTETALMIRM